jgi:hypothetical protein
MAPRTCITSCACKLGTAESVLQLVDSLPPDERAKLFDLLVRRPDNAPIRYIRDSFVRLITLNRELRERMEDMQRLSDLLHRLKHAELQLEHSKDASRGLHEAYEITLRVLTDLEKALAEIQNRVPKRKMSPTRVATAEAYQRLLAEHGKQVRAMHALVNLPEERKKAYARKYFATKDGEALRQYIKQLMRDFVRRPGDGSSVLPGQPEVAKEILDFRRYSNSYKKLSE